MARAGVHQTIDIEYRVRGQQQVVSSTEQIRRNIFGLTSALGGMNTKVLESGQRLDFLRLRLSGIREDISLLRNNLLLFVFATGGLVRGLEKAVQSATKFQTALAGLSTIAFNTGNRMDDVRQAALRLTDDGLLSIAGAAEGLRNLLATGLNLKQSIDLMNVFKDAAAFNRQGILDFEEAIVRATAGVKMQQAKLIDDVGIRTRVGQMLEKQGFQLEDLTNETTKAAAVQALYIGLMKEGSFFQGDAVKLTETYAGAHARLTTQMLRTSAAFGNILTGTQESPGIFATASHGIGDLLVSLEKWLKANKELIGQKIQTYFENFMSILDKLIFIGKGLWLVFSPIIELLTKSWVGPWLLAGIAIEKFGSRLYNVQKRIKEFAGIYGSKEGRLQMELINSLKPEQRQIASDSFAFLTNKKGAAKEFDLLKKDLTKYYKELNDITTKSFKTTVKQEHDAKGRFLPIDRNKVKQELDALITSQNIAKNALFKDLDSISEKIKTSHIGNIKDIERSINDLAKKHNVSATIITNALLGTNDAFNKINTVMGTTTTKVGLMKAAFISLSAWIKTTSVAIKILLIDMLPFLAIQAVFMAAAWAYSKWKESEEEDIALKEKLKNLDAESHIRVKEGIQDKLAELNAVKDSMEEYQRLHDSIFKTTQQQDRMNELTKDITDKLKKYGIEADFMTGKELDKAAAYNETNKAIETQMKNLQTLSKMEALELQRKTQNIITENARNTVVPSEEIASLIRMFGGNVKDLGGTEHTISQQGFESNLTSFEKLFKSQDYSKLEPLISFFQKINKELETENKQLTKALDLHTELKAGRLSQVEYLKKILEIQTQFPNAKQGIFSSPDAIKGELNSIDAFIFRIQKIFALFGSDNLTIMQKTKETIDGIIKSMTEDGGKKSTTLPARLQTLESNLDASLKKSEFLTDLPNKLIEIAKQANNTNISFKEMSKSLGAEFNPDLERIKEKILRASAAERKKALDAELESYRPINEELESNLSLLGQTEYMQKKIQIIAKSNKEISKWELVLAESRKANIPEMIKFFENLIGNQKEYTNGLLKQAQIEEDYKNQSAFTTQFHSLTREESSIKNKIKLLTMSKDAQDSYNTTVEETNILEDLQNKQDLLQLDLRKKALPLTEEEQKLFEYENESLARQIALWKEYYKALQPILEVEKELIRVKAQRDLTTKQATTRTGASGALMDIFSGGQTVGLDIASIYSSYKKKANVQDEVDAWKKKTENIGKDFEAAAAAGESEAVRIKNAQIDAAESTQEAWTQAFSQIANMLTSTYDLFALKEFERSVTARENLKTELFLLEDSFKHREISAKEFSVQRDLLNKKAAIEEVKAAKMRRAEEEITFGKILEGLAIEFAVKALGALASGNFASAALYGAAATLAGSQGVALQKSGLEARAKAEAEYNRDITLADREAQRKLGNSNNSGGAGTANNGRSISGSITAQELKITIAPSIVIQGEYINISNTGIEEASRILGDGMVNRIQEAIDNKELNLVNAVN